MEMTNVILVVFSGGQEQEYGQSTIWLDQGEQVSHVGTKFMTLCSSMYV